MGSLCRRQPRDYFTAVDKPEFDVWIRPTDRVTLTATQRSRIAVIGGATLDGPRHVWWNFVSSRKERIEQAKNEWREGKFSLPGDEIESIPLPENRPYTAGG